MPWYKRKGKIETPLSEQDFLNVMEKGYFAKPSHKAFVALLYYTGIRKGEALRAKREQFWVAEGFLFFDVGRRLKGGKTTPPLNLPLNAPYVSLIWEAVQKTRKGQRVFPFTDVTAWHIVRRAFGSYPHHLRLSRITDFLEKGFTIPEVMAWTGHKTTKAVDAYVGLVSVKRMGESLAKEKSK